MKKDENPVRVVRDIVNLHSDRVVRGVIEDQYLGKNPDSMKKASRAAGRWEEACVENGLLVSWVHASDWQSHVLGVRKGKRDQLKKVAQTIARSETKVSLTQDESDAYLLGRFSATLLALGRFKY